MTQLGRSCCQTFDSVDLGNLLDPFGETGVDDYSDGCIYRLQGKQNFFFIWIQKVIGVQECLDK